MDIAPPLRHSPAVGKGILPHGHRPALAPLTCTRNSVLSRLMASFSPLLLADRMLSIYAHQYATDRT
jgi:hypothetical protein